MLQDVTQTLDKSLVITILLAIGGWVIALLLQRHNIKEQHRTQVKYDIYKQLTILHREVQNTLFILGTIYPPFILMDCAMIPFNVGSKKEYKGTWIPYTELECVFEGSKDWNNFMKELDQNYLNYCDVALDLLWAFDDWEAAIAKLLPEKKILFQEVKTLEESIRAKINQLRSYQPNGSPDWRSWNREEIKSVLQNINDDATTITTYMSDFMVLVHNTLLGSYFGHLREERQTLGSKYKVLSKGGFKENLDYQLMEKTIEWTTGLVQLANEKIEEARESDETNSYLSVETITQGCCHVCKENLQVVYVGQNGYLFSCGHSCKKDLSDL